MTDNLKLAFSHTLSAPAVGEKAVTLAQLHAGYEDFLRNPAEYVETIVDCEIKALERSVPTFSRELNFGQFRVRDVVAIEPAGKITTAIEAQGEIPASRFEIEFTESAERIDMKFSYFEAPVPGVSDSSALHGLRQQAWQKKDEDVLAAILQLFAAY